MKNIIFKNHDMGPTEVKFLGVDRNLQEPGHLKTGHIDVIRKALRSSGGEWYENCVCGGYWEEGDSFLFTHKGCKDLFCISRTFLKRLIKQTRGVDKAK